MICGDYEIIVVDDGSTDATADRVCACAGERTSVRLISHPSNMGYGSALRTGFAAARKGLVAFTDADRQFDLTELNRFVLLADRYDVVCGYRIDRKDGAMRCFCSGVYNLFSRILLQTGVRDVDCALKMFRHDVIQNIQISGDGFLVNSEILTQVHQRGYSLVEVGVSHRERVDGNRAVSASDIPKILSNLARYWWNSVQFPGSRAPSVSGNFAIASTDRNLRWLQFALLLVAAIFLLSNLGYPLIDRDETRYAEIPREMLATGNWVLPQLNFQPYYDKPPLMYWLCAISFKLFGVSESAARLVPALAALGTIACTMFFGTRRFGRHIGLLAGGVLMLSVGFVFTSRYLLLDGLLTLFLCTAMFAAYEAIRTTKIKMGWWCLSSIACGLALMTKGPLAVVIWFPPVFAMAWLSEGHARPRYWHYLLTTLIVAVIALPWSIAVTMQDPEFVKQFFLVHNVARYAGELPAHSIFYFVPVLLLAGHPWSFLTIPYTRFLFAKSGDARIRRPVTIGYLMLWSLWCFVFFSFSSSKTPTYLLPAAPALAIMIGHFVDQMMRQTDSPTEHWFANFWSARGATIATCLGGVGFVIYVVAIGVEVSSSIYLWAMMWSGMLVMAILLINDRYQSKLAWASSASAAFLLAIMVMHQVVPAYGRDKTILGSDRDLIKNLAEMSDAIDTLPMATVSREFAEVPFYLRRNDIVNFPHALDRRLEGFVRLHPSTLLVVQPGVDEQLLRRSLPPGTRVLPLAQRNSASIVQVTPPQSALRPAARIATRPTGE